MGYAHRDIKPENMLLDDNFNLKLVDFGFATKEVESTSRKGTFGYMAPELVANEKYNCKQVDLYGAAVVLFILATQHPPFMKADPDDKFYKRIHDGNWERFWDIHSDLKLSSEFMDLITRMLQPNPNDRLNIKEIKEHPWYKGSVPSMEEIKQEFTKRKEGIEKKTRNQKSKAKSSTATKVSDSSKKMTKFFNVDDGDELLDRVVEYAKANGHKYEKSKEYFRLQVIVEKDNEEVCIMFSVLKKPDTSKRCLELKRLDGSQELFEETYQKISKALV